MDFERVLTLVSGFFDGIERPYGVIGALGLAARGIARTTFDVDIVAEAEVQDELIAFLEARGFTTEHQSSGYSNHIHDDSELGRLDVMYVRGETAQRIFQGITDHAGPGGLRIPVPRAEHLAAMKVFAIKNNPRRALQDLEDIGRILDLPGVDREEIEGYFTRHGLEDLLDRLE